MLGATGNQGGAVARELLENKHEVRIVTRNRNSRRAKELQEMGADVVQGDFNDLHLIQHAAEGVDAAFVVTIPGEEETSTGKSIIRELEKSNVPHIIFTSVASAHRSTGIPHFDS